MSEQASLWTEEQPRLDFRVPRDWTKTLNRLRDAGLVNSDILEAGRITRARMSQSGLDDPWRYFCGVAWNMVVDKDKLDVMGPLEKIVRSDRL